MDDNILDGMDLPLSNPKEELETISNQLLIPLFDVSKFEVRPEAVKDKGIDFHIELKTPTKHSNFRLVIQLKATDSKKANADGTISLQVDTRNINYLLNNPGPAYYVLYFKSTNTFYYENLNDFVKTLAEKDIDWKDQESHVLRFTKLLTKDAINGIYKETLQRGIFHRKVNEKLIQQSASIRSDDKILIDSNLNISDDAEIKRLVETGGFLLVNEGRWKDLIVLHKKGSQAIASTAKYNLIIGVAYYYLGNHIDALSFLKVSQKLKDELSPDLLTHLEYFLISVKQSLGLCTEADYLKNIDEMEDADGIGLYVKIEKVKTEYYNNLSDKSEDRFNKFFNEIQAILNHPKADKLLRFHAESELILVWGSKNNWDYVNSVAMINTMETVTGPDRAMRLESFKRFTDSYDNWNGEVHRIKTETFKERNYFHYFQIILNEIKVAYEMTVFTKAIRIEISMPGMPELKLIDQRSLFKGLLEMLDEAMKFYRQIGHIENEVVALSLRYELEHYLGDFSKADETISEAESLVDTYELTDKKRRLNTIKNKGTTHEKFSDWIDSFFQEEQAGRKAIEAMIHEMKKMDEEERKLKLPKTKYFNIQLIPLGYFRFPEKSIDKVYEILCIKEAKLKEHFDQLFKFVIPVANVFYPEIIQEGPLDGRLADKGLESWKNIYRVRKAFYENKFYRDESIS